MKLVGVYYPNLRRRPDRNTFMQYSLAGQDFKESDVRRIEAHDHKDYETKEAVCDAAIADGFPFFSALRKQKEVGLKKGDVACQWTWCAGLRLLSEQLGADECAIYMLDDFLVRKPRDGYQALVSNLEDLLILQIFQWFPSQEPEVNLDAELFGPVNFTTAPQCDAVYQGFHAAGDSMLILSQAGAKLALDWIEGFPYNYMEKQIYLRSQEVIEGCYSVKDPHEWCGFIPDSICGTDRFMAGSNMPRTSRKIDKWYYINLADRVDKHHVQQAMCAVHGVPFERLERFPAAIDNESCPRDIRALAQMMIDDGFEEWSWFLENETWFQPHWLASEWSKLRLLRQIIERGENAVMSTDVTFLNRDFFELEDMQSRLPDLEVLHLSWWYDKEDETHKAHYAKMKKTGVEGIFSNFMLMGGAAIYFTLEGAKNFMAMRKEWPNNNIESFAFYRGLHTPEKIKGFYACDPSPMKQMWSGKPGYEITTKDKSHNHDVRRD